MLPIFTDWSRPQPDSLFAEVSGLRVHYKRSGHGPPVLLLHGSASSLHHFEGCASALAGSYDVIRPDLPGFGLTGAHPNRDYRVSAYTTTVATFMHALGVPRYAVVGNSFGGNIAWNLALDLPDRVRALVLVNATGYPEKSLPAGMRLAQHPLVRPVMRRWMPRAMIERSLRSVIGPTSHLLDDPAIVDRAHALMNLPGNRSAFVDFVNTQQVNRSASIPDVTAPTLVLRSAGIDGQHFARDIRGARESVHDGGGHLLPEEDPAWVAAAIARFLGEVS